MKLNLKQIALFIGDLVILYSSLYLTLLLRYQKLPEYGAWISHFDIFTIIFAVLVLIFYISGLYSIQSAVNNTRFFRLVIQNLSIAAVFSVLFFYLWGDSQITPKTNLVVFFVIFAFLFIGWRRFYNSSLKSYLPKNKIAIIGFNHQVQELIQEIEDNPHLGYKIDFIIAHKSENGTDKDYKILENIGGFKKALIENKIATIVIASDIRSSPELRSALFECLPLKIKYINIAKFYEELTGKISINSIDKIWFLENLSQGGQRWFSIFKRISDIIWAISVLALSLPLWPLIAAIIKLTSKGGVFFCQTRCGLNERPFKLIKFRTMRQDAEREGPQWARKNDPRVTPFGKFLRLARLDELPQAINVLRGEMSFIGPRPERPEFVDSLKQKIPFYSERHLIKGGLTGWAQINYPYGSSEEDALKKLQYDLFYIKNRSIYLDISILLKTIATVLSRGGR